MPPEFAGGTPSGTRPPADWGAQLRGNPGGIDEHVRLSLRLVVHLSRVGPPENEWVARPESTQQAIAEQLQVSQGAVSKVLARLAAAGMVEEARRHVPGRNRRVMVYYLTAHGHDLARDILGRFGPADGSATSP
ncbi:MAG TPA: MarR family winged helix-turn-helix transcriptional regulator [Thermoplasmata archaeon]|nr:MarR family winged helix-turn-helix transcriptional regulator [Thermoplasmata archaeon]